MGAKAQGATAEVTDVFMRSSEGVSMSRERKGKRTLSEQERVLFVRLMLQVHTYPGERDDQTTAD